MNSSILLLLTIALVSIATADICTPGYYKLKSGVCRKCPKGTFQANADKYACRPCPPGKVATKAGSTKCTGCPKNSNASKNRNKCVCKAGFEMNGRKCVPCRPGTFFDTDYCNLCSHGYFQPKAGQLQCLKCPKGSYSVYGASKCVTCAEGEYFQFSLGVCISCNAGEKFDGEFCSECDPNFYKPKPGKGPYLPCPIGTHSHRGAKRCLPCPKGTVLLKGGKCGTCPAGSYFDKDGRKCAKCDVHTFTPHDNVKPSCYSCSGKEFAMKGASKCVKCPKNRYLLKNGKCKHCPQGSIYDQYNLKCMKCRVNEFNRGNMAYCASCPTDTYSLPGSTTCFTCPGETVLILAKKDCGSCPPNKYYDRNQARCV